MQDFKQEVNKAMRMLAKQPNVVFVGQSMRYDGAAIYDSMDGVPMKLRQEMPVIEDFQLGYCIGLSLGGKLHVCIYPRMDFMLLCMNQLVNHLDKLPLWGWRPRIILRTRVGSRRPLNAGPQHTQDHTNAFRKMLTSVEVVRVEVPKDVLPAYRRALAAKRSTLVIERPGQGY